MRMTCQLICLFLFSLIVNVSVSAETDYAKLPVRDGDMVVVVGDSITVSAAYMQVIDCYFQTRFPKWKVCFRNAGVNGYRADLGLSIIQADVLAWKPTVVLINYGMNDGRGTNGYELYTTNIVPYIAKARSAGARIILCSNSPLDIGDQPGKFTDFNVNFDKMANFAREYAAKENILFIDQFHFLHDLWGRNRQRKEVIITSPQALTPERPNDSVHPAPAGHLTMAYAILKGLGVPSEVSYAAIDVTTKKAKTRHCAISNLVCESGATRFIRMDKAAPCAFKNEMLPGNELVPFFDELNSMPLIVGGLPEGVYDVYENEKVLTRVTSKELAAGINLGAFPQSAAFEPGRQVLALIQKRYPVQNAARDVLKFASPGWARLDNLEEQKKKEWNAINDKVKALDDAISAAAQPNPLSFRIVPATK